MYRSRGVVLASLFQKALSSSTSSTVGVSQQFVNDAAFFAVRSLTTGASQEFNQRIFGLKNTRAFNVSSKSAQEGFKGQERPTEPSSHQRSGQTLGVYAQRSRGHTCPFRYC
eukprot:TRINITY_DN1343_c0_g1_i5.p3 TRINITY_DN1343_c0_g1~~TRINITY_DN1343_c0_g1_i5.p3  ORF type:complete len:112 (-),score=5.83 TRINITY_DN1343_c0_g1_i5:13-348(-)